MDLRSSCNWTRFPVRNYWVSTFLTIACVVSFVSAQAQPKEAFYTDLSEALANKGQATHVDLSKQKLDTLPSELFELTELRVLVLRKNKLRELSPTISSLSKLEILDISKNKLQKLPPEIGDLTQLVELRAHQNDLDSLPSEIGQLKELRVLELWDNNLSMLPEEVRECTRLEVVDIRAIQFDEEEQDYIKQLLPFDADLRIDPPCACY